MGSSPLPSRLTALQRDLLRGFFEREGRFFLTEIKDLVDPRELLNAGVDLERALADARMKDGGVELRALAFARTKQ